MLEALGGLELRDPSRLAALAHLDAEHPSGRVRIGVDIAVLPDRDAIKLWTLAAKPRIGRPDLKGGPARCQLQDVRLEGVRHVHCAIGAHDHGSA